MRLPIPVIIASLIITVLIDWYNYRQASKCAELPHRKWVRPAYIATIIVGVGLILAAVIIPKRTATGSVLPAMWILYTWASVYVVKILFAIFSIIGKIPAFFHRKPIGLGFWAGIPLGVIFAFCMWWGALVTVREIDVRTVEIESQRIPKGFDNYRIVQFSDAHVGTWGEDTTFVSKLVDSINSLKPDVVFFTGDIVNRQTSEIEPFLPVLRRLHAPDGVFAVLGNHDYGDYISWDTESAKTENLQQLKNHLKNSGWSLLDNTHTYLTSDNDSIALIGVGNWGEPPFRQYGDLQSALTARGDTILAGSPRQFAILLSHNPEHWNQHISKETGIDLTLSGHTHAMQFMFALGKWKWSPAEWRYEQWGGLYERRNKQGKTTKIYVNIGSGEVGIPARIGAATPEITLLILRHVE